MRIARFVLVIGASMVLLALIVPSAAVIRFLRPGIAPLPANLILGATLLRVAMGLLGVFIALLAQLPTWMPPIATHKPASGGSGVFVRAVLAGILVTALGLRLYKLGSGVWYDEIFTYVHYMDLSLGQIVTTYDELNNHLLYTVAARLSFQVFGPSVWSLRLPAVLWGVGSIWALYTFASLVATRREALLSAAFLALSYQHVWFSQNARGYTGLLFFSLISSWLLIKALRSGGPQLWAGYAITATIGMYTHMTMLFLVGGQLIVTLITAFGEHGERSSGWWRGPFFGFGLTAILTFLLYALVIPQFIEAFGAPQGTGTVWANPFWMVSEFVKGMDVSFRGSAVAFTVLLLVGAGVVGFRRKEPIAIWLLIIPALGGFLAMMAARFTLFPRFFFFSLGFAVLVVVRGTTVLGDRLERLLGLRIREGAWAGSAICASVIAVSALSIPAAYLPKQDYKAALRYVQKNVEPGDVVVTVGLTVLPYSSYWKVPWPSVETLEDLDRLRSGSKRTWLLYTIPVHMEAKYPGIMASIERDFTVVKEFPGSLGGGTIWVCRSDAPSSVGTSLPVTPTRPRPRMGVSAHVNR